MTINDIPKLRLLNQQLTKTKYDRPEEVVKHLGAVQSQDFSGAKWALGQRLKNSSDAEIEQAFNDGKILRTHALRPTWHFVDPSDIRWLIELNAPQVKRIMNYYNKILELDDEIFKKTNSIIEKAFTGKDYLTRNELKEELSKYGITGTGQRIGHIVGWAELDGIICSGPRRGKQFTYALIKKMAPNAKSISRDEALSKLAKIFFETRGPATIRDFSKWSGLSMNDSERGINLVKSKLKTAAIEGKEYLFSENSRSAISSQPSALLLPNYDEYISSYADYSVISKPEHMKNLDLKGNAAFWNHIIINGMVAGSWRRIFKPKAVEVELSLLRNLTKRENSAIENELKNYGKFLNLRVVVN